MKIKQINKNELHDINPFVSSYWALLKKTNGWLNESYLVDFDGKKFQLLLLYKKIIDKNYLAYIPFSPISINGNFTLSKLELKSCLDRIIEISSFKIIFYKIDLPFDYSNSQNFNGIFKLNKYSIQPDVTIILDLQKSLNEVRFGYKKRAKRNLKKCENQVVVTEVEPNSNNIKTWYNIYVETAKRDGFHTRNLEYFSKIFSIQDEIIKPKLIFATFKGEVVGGIIILLSKVEAVYLFGASKKIPALAPSYALQDYAIELSHKLGIKKYDFFGVGNNEKSKHLQSLTLFKASFGGEIFERVSTLDYPVNKFLYFCYKRIENLRSFLVR